MRISDGSSDVCSSDLEEDGFAGPCLAGEDAEAGPELQVERVDEDDVADGKAGQHGPAFAIAEMGRASCRERACQFVSISVVAVYLQKKQTEQLSHVTQNHQRRKQQNHTNTYQK